MIHRDLRPDVILFDDNFEPRICDFGRIYVEEIASLGWQRPDITSPPELLDVVNYTDSDKTDVYSYAVILYMLFHKPVQLDDAYVIRWHLMHILFERVRNGVRLAHHGSIPKFYWKLIQACWCHVRHFRPSFAQIVELLRDNRSWVIPGTNLDKLYEYEERVLPPRDSQVFKFDMNCPWTADVDLELFDPTPAFTHKLICKGNFHFAEGRAHSIADGRVFAVKAIANDIDQSAMQQLEAMSMTTHPAMFSVIGWRPAGPSNCFQILMDDCPNGTLSDAIRLSREGHGPTGWTPTKQTMSVIGIACAMKAMHENGVIHGDLRMENVLLDDKFEVHVRYDGADSAAAPVSSHGPETFTGGAGRSLRSDIYSYGILLYRMFSEANILDNCPGELLASEDELTQRIARGFRFIRHPGIPDFYWDMIRWCWQHCPEDRPSAREVVERLLLSGQGYAFPGADVEAVRQYELKVK
jgi:serine/threonine protein kinase